MSMFRSLLMAKSGGGDVGLSAEAIAYCNQYSVLSDVVAYCKDDPDIVEYINEYNPLIHSLVDSGYTPYLYNESSLGYINSGVYITDNSNVELVIKYTSNSMNGVIDNSRSGAKSAWIAYNQAGFQKYIVYNFPKDKRTKIRVNRNGCYLNDQELMSFGGVEFFGHLEDTFYLFALKTDGSATIGGRSYVSYCHFIDINKKFVPYKNKTMLDIYSGDIIYPNSELYFTNILEQNL